MSTFTVIDWPALHEKMEALPGHQLDQFLEAITRLKNADPEAVRLFQLFELGMVSAEFVLMALSG